jgi:2'-5' RNA ligase
MENGSPDPVTEKIRSLREQGKEAFNKNTVKGFSSFAPDYYKTVITALVQTKPPFPRLISVVREIAEELRLNPFTASIDFPLHCTVLRGTASKALMMADRFPISQAEPLREMQFPEIVIDGEGNVLLMANPIVENFLKERRQISRAFKKRGFEPVDLDEMCYMTIQRIRVNRWRMRKAVPKEYFERLSELGSRYSERIRFDEIYFGPLIGLFKFYNHKRPWR